MDDEIKPYPKAVTACTMLCTSALMGLFHKVKRSPMQGLIGVIIYFNHILPWCSHAVEVSYLAIIGSVC